MSNEEPPFRDTEGRAALFRVVSTVWERGAERSGTRHFITSPTDVGDFARAVRGHWAMENQLHRSLVVVFREDVARARKVNSPLNINVFRKTAPMCLDQAKYGRIRRR